MKRFIGWLLSFFVAAPAWPSSLTYAEWQGARIKAEQRRAREARRSHRGQQRQHRRGQLQQRRQSFDPGRIQLHGLDAGDLLQRRGQLLDARRRSAFAIVGIAIIFDRVSQASLSLCRQGEKNNRIESPSSKA